MKNSALKIIRSERRRIFMQKNQQAKGNTGSAMQPGYSGTDAENVKQQIQKDVAAGQGAMTSREAGSMRN
jgi:hypothetical protein